MNLPILVAGMKPESELFKLMAYSVQDYAIFLLDPSGKVGSWNSGARRMKQYEEAEIIGQHFSVFYTGQDIDRGWPTRELQVAAKPGGSKMKAGVCARTVRSSGQCHHHCSSGRQWQYSGIFKNYPGSH